MAIWVDSVRAAVSLIENIEQCLSENCINFRRITLYPFRTQGGRSNGVTADFDYCPGKNVYITVYEHWNTDNVCIQFNMHQPVFLDNKHHDVPHVQFKNDDIAAICYAIQSFIVQVFDIEYPNEWLVPYSGFRGITTIDNKTMESVDDHMMPVLMDWIDPEG